VKYDPIQSNVLKGSRIHDLLVHTMRMCFTSRYKYVVIITIRIFLFSLFVIFLVEKTYNIAQSAIIETQFCTLVQNELPPLFHRNNMVASLLWVSSPRASTSHALNMSLHSSL
jgi:hypothetical protein